jgi:hypothetical protein
MARTQQQGHHPLALAGLSVFVSAIYAAAVLPMLLIVRLWLSRGSDAWAWAGMLLCVAAAVTPLEWTDTEIARRAVGAICGAACDYFPITVKLEDEDALKASVPRIFGYEPHSAMPVG